MILAIVVVGAILYLGGEYVMAYLHQQRVPNMSDAELEAVIQSSDGLDYGGLKSKCCDELQDREQRRAMLERAQ